MAFAEPLARAPAPAHLPAGAARRRRAAARDDHRLAAGRRVGPGPSDRRMYTIEAPGKRPYKPGPDADDAAVARDDRRAPAMPSPPRPFRPPAARRPGASAPCTSTAAPASRSTSGRTTSARRSTGTSPATSSGSSWSRSGTGRTRTWATATSRSGQRRARPDGVADYALNFDVIGHEIGHALMMAFAGRFSPDRVTADYEALHEASADWAAMIASLHLDAVVEELLETHARRPRHREPAEPLRRALLDPADPHGQQQPDDVGLRARLVERARARAAADRRAVRRLRRDLQGDPRPPRRHPARARRPRRHGRARPGLARPGPRRLRPRLRPPSGALPRRASPRRARSRRR